MNDNHKTTTRNHDEGRQTEASNEDRQPHNSKEQLASASSAEKSSVQAAAMIKKLKRNNRPRPLL